MTTEAKSKWLMNLKSFSLTQKEEINRLNNKIIKPKIGIINICIFSPIKSTPNSTFECKYIKSCSALMYI